LHRVTGNDAAIASPRYSLAGGDGSETLGMGHDGNGLHLLPRY
jgi:hypothetical protein